MEKQWREQRVNPGYKDLATREEKTQFDTIRYNNEGRRHDDQVRLISRLLGGVQQNTTRLKHVSLMETKTLLSSLKTFWDAVGL